MSNRSDVVPAETVPGAERAPAACAPFHADASTIARIRRRLLDARSGAALAETFKVLGDVTRLRLLNALAHGELCVCDLATLVGITESAVSHQLRLLRNMRVVRTRRAGRMVFYALDDEHVIGLFEQGLRHVQETEPRAVAAPPRRRPGASRRRLSAAGAAK